MVTPHFVIFSVAQIKSFVKNYAILILKGAFMDEYQGYGISVDEDELSEEEKAAYDSGYLDGYNSGMKLSLCFA